MITIAAICLTLFCSTSLYAVKENTGNRFTLSGIIILKDTQKPLSGISVGIEELKIIIQSDKEGRFSFKNIELGKYHLFISHPTYEQRIIPIRLKRNFYIKIKLKKARYTLDKTNNFYHRREDRFGEQYITRDNIKDLPGRGAGDSLHLLQTLPGIGSGFALATVPLIRGGNPLYDRYYIDDIPVDYPYHYLASIVPLFSSINEEIIDRAYVSKGLSPMYYDDNLGNIIHIKTRNTEESGIHSKMIFDPVIPVFPTLYAGIAPTRNLSLICAGRRSYYDWIIDYDEADIYFQDHYLKICYNLFSKHRLYFITFGADDKLSMNDYSTRSRFNIEALKWEYLITRRLLLKTVLSSYRTEYYLENKRIYEDMAGIYLRFDPTQYRIFQMLNASIENYYIKLGYEIIEHKNGIEGNITLNDIPDIDILDQTSYELNTKFPIEGRSLSVFSEIGAQYDHVWINLGFRFKRYGPLNNKSISYRGMCGYNINNSNSIYVGGGLYHAHPDMYYYLGEFNPKFKDSKAYNGILGIKSRFFSAFTGQVELYRSHYYDITAANIDIVNESEYKKITQINPFSIEEEGITYGIEFFLKGKWKNLYGWISYAYSVSKRSSKSYNLDNYYSDFDQTNIFKLALSSHIDNWTPSLIWHYYTAQPYTPVAGSTENLGSYTAEYGDNNSARHAPHHRLDVKLSYTTEDKIKFYIELWNMYNKENTIFYTFNEDRPYSDDNPESQTDYPPIFVWAGIELCF
ncbi:MAG: TonB-dependent receptor [Spirochaetota bacterium]|nr:TonB-dependent receptor [Spirochaetota bacterium]